MERQNVFSAIVFVLAVAFSASVSGRCVDAEHGPDKFIILGQNRTICQEAKLADIPCQVLLKCLEFQNLSIDTSKSVLGKMIRIPHQSEIDSAEKLLGIVAEPKKAESCTVKEKAKPSKNKTKAQGRKHAPIVCSGELHSMYFGRMPFDLVDYTRCLYIVTSLDEEKGMTFVDLAGNFNSPASRIAWFNRMSVLTKLKNGMQIAIPDWDHTYYCSPGSNPVKERSLEELKAVVWPKLRFFQQHPELIDVLAKMYISGGKHSSVRSGEMFSQWMSGDCKAPGHCIAIDNGVAAFSADTFLGAKRFDIPIPGLDSVVAIVKLIDVCFNWTIAFGPPEPVFRDSTPTPKTRSPDTNDVWNPNPSKDSIPSMSDIDMGRTNEWRFGAWIGDDRPIINPRLQGGQFWGLKLDLLRPKIDGGDVIIPGLTAMLDGWYGQSRTNFGYGGFEGSAGPLAIWCINQSLYWGFDLCGGGEWNWGWQHARKYDYDGFQTNLFLNHGESFDAIFLKWHWSFWGNLKYTFAGQRQSTRNGIHTLQGETKNPDTLDLVIDNSGADGGLRIYFRQWPVEPLLVGRTSYSVDDHALSLSIGLGVAFCKESWIFEVAFKDRRHSKYLDNNGRAIEAVASYFGGPGRWFKW